MNKERAAKVLLSINVTEKASLIESASNQYVFSVAPDATKPEIKQAVETMCEVQVESVQVLNMKGKVKRFGQRFGRRKNQRKAYVRLKDGQSLDFAGAE